MAIVHNAPISGFMKLWLYQKFVLGMLSWPLMIQDLNLDFVKTQLTRPCGVILKKWAGAFDSIDVGCLYRPKERFGLELTPVSVLFKKLQVIKLHLLKNSPDPHISALYEIRRRREEPHQSIWRPTQLLEQVSASPRSSVA